MELLGSCLPDDTSQHSRLQDAVAHAREILGMLPLTQRPDHVAEITVDCFIVACVGPRVESSARRAKAELPSFLLGFRAHACNGGMVPNVDMRSDDIQCEGLRQTCDQSPDDGLTVSSSVPETTATGRIFSDMNLAH